MVPQSVVWGYFYICSIEQFDYQLVVDDINEEEEGDLWDELESALFMKIQSILNGTLTEHIPSPTSNPSHPNEQGLLFHLRRLRYVKFIDFTQS